METTHTKGENSMSKEKTINQEFWGVKEEITINKEFARTLRDAVEDHRFNGIDNPYGSSPLDISTNTVSACRDAEGNPVITIKVKMEGTVIGEVELSLQDALVLSANISGSVRYCMDRVR
jgi:hypothetical protein